MATPWTREKRCKDCKFYDKKLEACMFAEPTVHILPWLPLQQRIKTISPHREPNEPRCGNFQEQPGS